jgi:hypothetical protein
MKKALIAAIMAALVGAPAAAAAGDPPRPPYPAPAKHWVTPDVRVQLFVQSGYYLPAPKKPRRPDIRHWPAV